MGKNPLGDGDKPKFDRKSWTPQQHCAHANRQLIENGVNEYRRKEKLFPVKWILVNDRVTITEGEPRLPVQIPHYTDETPNYPTIPSS